MSCCALQRTWKPTACLPKMYMDREIRMGPAKDVTALGLSPTDELLDKAPPTRV
jgi:hypothetical protein